MTLDYLDFDYSEDEGGNGTWDAMASVAQDRWGALRAEVRHVKAATGTLTSAPKTMTTSAHCFWNGTARPPV